MMPMPNLRPECLRSLLGLKEFDFLRRVWAGTEYQGQVFLVGGAVRDSLLGREREFDLDLVTELDPVPLLDRMLEWNWTPPGPPLAASQGEGSDAGIASFQVRQLGGLAGREFGVYRFGLGAFEFEIVRARGEVYSEDSRRPSVYPAGLKEDVMRRDFTVNALLADLDSGEVHDLTGRGLSDLQQGVLRTPLEPGSTFFDDPLRMLRAIRFRCQLGFEPVEGLYEAIRSQASRLQVISAERIRDEFEKILLSPRVGLGLQDLLETGLLNEFAPDLVAMVGVEQGSFHHLDAWGHTVRVVESTAADLRLRLAALLHDVGKPATRFVDESGRTRFFGHAELGAKMAAEWLRSMRFPGDVIREVEFLVHHHMRLGDTSKWSAAAARRLVRDMGPSLERFLQLVEADGRGMKADARKLDLVSIRELIDSVKLPAAGRQFESPLDGREIQRLLGLSPGPAVGRAKTWLTERVLEGELAPLDSEMAQKILLERYQQEAPATEGDSTQ